MSNAGTVPGALFSSPHDVLKLVAYTGYAVIGMNSDLWSKYNVLRVLMSNNSASAAIVVHDNSSKSKIIPKVPFGTAPLLMEWTLVNVQKIQLSNTSPSGGTDTSFDYYIAVVKKK